jgi:CheY-like chemotaxis protein
VIKAVLKVPHVSLMDQRGIERQPAERLCLSLMGNVQVILVDDYPEMRELLRDILDRYPEISVIGEAETGEDAVAKVTRLRPPVVIIDFQLPTMSGIEATRLIRLQSPSTVVIGLTAGVLTDAERPSGFKPGPLGLACSVVIFTGRRQNLLQCQP